MVRTGPEARFSEALYIRTDEADIDCCIAAIGAAPPAEMKSPWPVVRRLNGPYCMNSVISVRSARLAA